MKTDDLDHLLRKLASRPLPSPPSNLEVSVWRTIRTRQQAPLWSWVDELAALISGRPVAWGTVAMAGALGLCLAWFLPANDPALRQINLGMEVFTEAAPSLPSTLLLAERL